MLNSDEWRASSNSSYGDMFVIMNKAAYPYDVALKHLGRILADKAVEMSVTQQNDLYLKFLEQIFRNNCDIETRCREFVTDILKHEEKQFTFFIPISDYDYNGKVIMPNIEIKRIADMIKEFNIGERYGLTHIQASHEANETDIYAIVRIVAATNVQAHDRAIHMAERLIYAIKLMDSESGATLRRYQVEPVVESVLYKYDNNVSSNMHRHNERARITPPNSFYVEIQPYLDKLGEFLIEPQTLLQVDIIDALYWYGRATVSEKSRIDIFLDLMIGMERIVLNKSKDKEKANLFGYRCSKIFAHTEKYLNFYKNYYIIRNRILHEKIADIYESDVATLRSCLRNLLLELIMLTDKYDNLDDVLAKKFNICK